MGFSEHVIQKVWEKGRVVTGNDPTVWRMDECNAWIARAHYGNRNSKYGWEIDHIIPVSHGGTDEISNLRPLQWENNAARQGGRLICVVRGYGTDNVRASHARGF